MPKNTSKAQLAALAKINLKQAEAAANAAVAGNVMGAKLEDENSCLVYSVQITGTDGKLHDVKVDAGNGKVVHQEIAGENEQEGEEDLLPAISQGEHSGPGIFPGPALFVTRNDRSLPHRKLRPALGTLLSEGALDHDRPRPRRRPSADSPYPHDPAFVVGPLGHQALRSA